MKHTIKRLLALALSTAMVCSLMSLPALAAGAKTDGIWNYTVSEDGTAAIVGAKDDYKSQSVVLIPAQLGGAAVQTIQFPLALLQVLKHCLQLHLCADQLML